MGPRNFDLKIAILGVGWERMGKLEMGESREIAKGKDGLGKGANLGQPRGDRDLKIAIVGVAWERMGKLEMGESGEIAMGENEWGKGVRKLEKRGQPKGDCVDLKIAIMDARKNG
ncbi:uncharacterized protein Gasu_61060 [Galdieria sulphuraria]|uniref:Uncharacterized protein n=1 Tax=Galdieria sulphuraria TaxID=130081 RepID=M2XS51_GALSU|nr:uncharacterized protein Gasu_61060 [Galdieria sulphuraria]EME26249.1 hypothetical protein Gasu_61060 [Galdieria sulphuraria]|eukprot:XP_005702769.1 hypothetical protein Gasu_61060 [Galdieria sulphuraria]